MSRPAALSRAFIRHYHGPGTDGIAPIHAHRSPTGADMTPNDTPTPDDDLLRRAKRRVDRKIGFHIHALVFVLVNAGLYFINTWHGGMRWHVWPLGWWAVGLAIHGIVTFVGLRGDGLRERMIDAEVERLKGRR